MTIPKPLKWIFWIVGTLTALATGAFFLLVWALSGYFEVSNDEVARVVSPNGKVDAVLFETNGGATTSFGYNIYLTEHGAQPSGSPAISLYGAVRNQRAYGANLKWIASDSVAVEFLRAKSKKIQKSTVSIGDQVVQIAVHEGIEDHAAPGGGMLYNLRGRR